MKSLSRNTIYKYISFGLLVLLINACDSSPKINKLPIIGHRQIIDGDTIYPKVRPFEFVNQDSITVDNGTFADGIYVTDFFFTSCPTICPKVKQQMIRVYEKYREEDRVKLVSFTVDPVRDTPNKLHDYAAKLEAELPKWHFLTGNKDSLHTIAGDYMSIALENPDAPGGFDHSGRLILVDRQGHVRAFCNGTDPEEVTDFLDKIDLLLSES